MLATFDTNQLIKEVVYVETDLDTDKDGVKDFVQSIFVQHKRCQLVYGIPLLPGTNDVVSDKNCTMLINHYNAKFLII